MFLRYNLGDMKGYHDRVIGGSICQRRDDFVTTIEVLITDPSEVTKKTSIAGCAVPGIQIECNVPHGYIIVTNIDDKVSR